MLLVSAHEAEGRAVLPGCLAGTIGVGLDPDCARDTYFCRGSDRRIFYASGFPRPIPGFPQERNLNGVSFAVANMTGFVARALERWPAGDVERILAENAVELAEH